MSRRKKTTHRRDVPPQHSGAAESPAIGVPPANGVNTAGSDNTAVAELPGPWRSLWFRRVVTVLLLLHLMAVVIAPLAVAPTSYLVGSLWTVFQPYLEAAYLNHGYHFFAPEPGPSHLIRFEVRRADGTTVTGEFPNIAEHRPRLFYHRHFMLTEFVNALGSSEATEDIANRYVRSYAHHLMVELDADEVDLYLRQHLIPLPEDVAAGKPLDDASLYEEQALGTFKRNEL
jgi:hypothetical protein